MAPTGDWKHCDNDSYRLLETPWVLDHVAAEQDVRTGALHGSHSQSERERERQAIGDNVTRQEPGRSVAPCVRA